VFGPRRYARERGVDRALEVFAGIDQGAVEVEDDEPDAG
jgi:hypothetical protein